jgi:hypothetical protein
MELQGPEDPNFKVYRLRGAQTNTGTVDVWNKNDNESDTEPTEFLTAPVGGGVTLQFELLDARGDVGRYDNFGLPMPWRPMEDCQIAPVCASCGLPWHGPYGGPPGHTPDATTLHEGEAAKWVSLQVFKDGVVFRPRARKWYGFARAESPPGQAAYCGTRQQVYLRLAMETHTVISKCIANAKTWWPHWFVNKEGFEEYVEIPSGLPVRMRNDYYHKYGEGSFIPNAEDWYRGDAILNNTSPQLECFSLPLLGPHRWESLMSRSDETGKWSFN